MKQKDSASLFEYLRPEELQANRFTRESFSKFASAMLKGASSERLSFEYRPDRPERTTNGAFLTWDEANDCRGSLVSTRESKPPLTLTVSSTSERWVTNLLELLPYAAHAQGDSIGFLKVYKSAMGAANLDTLYFPEHKCFVTRAKIDEILAGKADKSEFYQQM